MRHNNIPPLIFQYNPVIFPTETSQTISETSANCKKYFTLKLSSYRKISIVASILYENRSINRNRNKY